jgi:thioredoxin-dependent peroxiredoxin
MRCSLATAAAALVAMAAHAALPDGARAPDFSAPATLAGKEFTFSLADSLKKGPVVLYFYPAAFTPGCTTEAHDFAEASDKFQELGATVIGVSHNDIATLDRFSVSECRNKFAVAADANGSIMRAYDAVMPSHPDYANRVSYVIAPTGAIIYTYSAMNPDKHVENTLAAVKKWQLEHSKSLDAAAGNMNRCSVSSLQVVKYQRERRAPTTLLQSRTNRSEPAKLLPSGTWAGAEGFFG